MAKKTPEQRIAELDAKRSRIEEKLKTEREAIVRAKRREHAKIMNKRRKDETRKKILIGSMYLDRLKDDPRKMDALINCLERYLTRNDDRTLFGLPPLPADADGE